MMRAVRSIENKWDKQPDVIIIEDQDVSYVRSAARVAARFNLLLRNFVSPLRTLDYLQKSQSSPKYILVDYFLPHMTGDMFIKKASSFAASHFILFSISGTKLLESLDNIIVYGIIKKQGIAHFERVLSYYLTESKQNIISLPFNYVLLRDLGILYLKTDPNVFIPLTRAENTFLSTYKAVDGIFAIKGILRSIVSISTVIRLNKKLVKYNVPFKIKRRFSSFVIESRE